MYSNFQNILKSIYCNCMLTLQMSDIVTGPIHASSFTTRNREALPKRVFVIASCIMRSVELSRQALIKRLRLIRTQAERPKGCIGRLNALSVLRGGFHETTRRQSGCLSAMFVNSSQA